MQLKELTTIEEMLTQIETIHFLYPKMTIEKYKEYLSLMLPHNYKQLAVFENDVCVGITGFWKGVKLWSGPYLEIDNFVVHPEYRKKGIGKLMTDYIDAKAKELGSTMIVLDAYVENFTAHKFYYNQGFVPRGYHFLKIINPEQLSS
ncbi:MULTISPECIES: GNAT family N-acetyltransferase [Flavobacterium]|uniref:N-acetyltransferase domain-containing protein n=1 Tax=Flavobacterium hankyongi TaxID=1176532 RepID=A0ABP8ZQ24_9FLAO|nr:GNAT family N-acetyltransferase [Flavobacterium sp. N1846]